MAIFRSLRLNQRTEINAENVFLDSSNWEKIEVDSINPGPKEPYILGLDAGSTTSLSSAAAYWYRTTELDGFSLVCTDPGLAERGLADGVGNLYCRMFQEGDLVMGGKYVADMSELLLEIQTRWGYPEAVYLDKFRLGEIRGFVEKQGWPKSIPLIPRIQGFISQGIDVRQARIACLSRNVKVRRSLGMRASISACRVTTDAAGNAKIVKSSFRKFDDLAVAIVMALAAGHRKMEEEKKVAANRPQGLQIIYAADVRPG